MSREDIAKAFIDKFLREHPSVFKRSLRTAFISINGDVAKVSSYPFSIENAEHCIILFMYEYNVWQTNDYSYIPLCFNATGDIEDFIEINGWKLSFNKPVTSSLHSGPAKVFIENGEKKIVLEWSRREDYFPRIWKLFTIAQTCTTQLELDFALKAYKDGVELDGLREKVLKDEAKIDALNMQLCSYKNLLEKIEQLVNNK